jgi:predicted SAM-dependent methyltransferase
MAMLTSIARNGATRGVRQAWRNLLTELHHMRLHRDGLRRSTTYADRTGLRLNFGCGANLKEGWVNIDLTSGADVPLDLREDIPFADRSATTIYCEHFLEHLDYPGEARHFLAECYRILDAGGVLHVGVPDTRWPLQAFAGLSDEDYFASAKRLGWHPEWCTTPIEHINFHFRQDGEHRFAYDYETLRNILADTGFVRVEQRDFDPRLDTTSRRVGTLYVSATKPPA